MLNDAICFSEIYIMCGRTDLRYGIESLAGVLKSLGIENPAAADTLYLFCGRRSDRIKGLVWEGDGFLLLYKKLADYLHDFLYKCHVIQADETPLLVNKDGRPAGSKSYMWVYRTGKYQTDKQVVLYDYQKTRKADHPREFLKNFRGVCVTDGYQVYHTLEGEREDLEIAGCWAHSRRRYEEESKLQDMESAERRRQRQKNIKPLVDAYFTWVYKNIEKLLPWSTELLAECRK